MKYLTLICLFILSACNLNDNIVELNDNTLKKTNVRILIYQIQNLKECLLMNLNYFLKNIQKTQSILI